MARRRVDTAPQFNVGADSVLIQQVSGSTSTIFEVKNSSGASVMAIDSSGATTATFAAGVGLPVGMITPFAGSTAPTGWLLCYGQAVSRTTYAALFAVLSTTYNTGVVAGTDFCLPDLRGRTVAGIDNMGGLDAGVLSIANTPGTTTGAETVALTSAQSGVPAHQHVNTLTNNAVTSGAGSLHQHGNSLTGTTTFASSGHAHNSGNFHAAIGATNGDPSRIGYVAGAVIGPGTATYSIVGSGTLTNSGNFNHYTPVYGDTGGPSATASVGISNAGEQAHTHSVTSNVTISNVNNTAANAAESHSVMQPTMVLNYIVRY